MIFIVWAIGSMATIGLLALALAVQIGGAAGAVEIGEVAGVWRLRQRQRLAAYAMFERALLVEIFVGQFLAFAESQFAAVFGLIRSTSWG